MNDKKKQKLMNNMKTEKKRKEPRYSDRML